MTRHSLRSLAVSVAILVALAAVANAGGPLLNRAPGQPFLWGGGGANIPWSPDQGGLGPLNNAQAVAQTASAFAAWDAIPTASTSYLNAGPLAVDVDETNFLPFLQPAAPDGLSAIVFDEDGAIFDLLFGPDSGVLGFAGPEWVNPATGEIIEGVAFMNGGALLGPTPFPIAEFLSVQVHEFGHYQNLAHTVVNGQAAGFADQTGPTPFNTFPPVSFANRIETMYPFLFVGGGQATPHADEIAIFSSLYPVPGFVANRGHLTGRILAPNGTTPLTGVNVIARNIANPYDDAVSAISSDFATDYSSGAPFVGVYTLHGLTPGASYAVFVDQILEGGFSTPPRQLPGPEELYNGAGESNDGTTDLPGVFTPVITAAGATSSGIDVVFNRLPPGPIPLGDDTSFEIFPDFKIRFCGTSYESVWVNANGSLTFGEPSSAFSESAAGMLTGPPRIAGLWDDLNPSAGGSVSFQQTAHSLKFRFEDVPEYPAAGANSFAITLRRTPFGHAQHGGRFTLDYGDLSARDGAAGYSCGRKTTSGFELETNLSRHKLPFILGLHKPAVYEVFTTADNDLEGDRFDVLTPKRFRDLFEPNNTPPTGPAGPHDVVKLPFDTSDRYSALTAGDVDFYRFRAQAGEIFAIETVPGSTLDTLLGLFDSDGNLVLVDDDGGVGGTGSLSRLLIQVVVDGVYTVGVTTWPDFGFTGAGSDTGRYVLSIRKYTGTLLALADDGSVEIPLTTFQFPFQGTDWSSVWVNANGNLTFGAGSADSSESVPELLSGPPRIAPLWDDLSPSSPSTGAPQGMVIVEEKQGQLLVHFASVPEFQTTGTNYFTVELNHKGDIKFDYGATNRSDGIVGVSQGGGAFDPGPTDLSRAWWLSARGTTYQPFAGSFGTYGGVDLSFKELTFRKH